MVAADVCLICEERGEDPGLIVYEDGLGGVRRFECVTCGAIWFARLGVRAAYEEELWPGQGN